MKKQYAIRIALAAAALVVWGHNLVQIVSGFKSESEPEWISERSAVRRQAEGTQAKGDSISVFMGRFNDPFLPDAFEPGRSGSGGAASSRLKRTVIDPGPPFRFIGYMADASGPLGVVESGQGSAIVHRGDTLLGVTVVKVLPESLAYRKSGKVKWVRLNP